KQAMLSDLVPSGQYATYTSTFHAGDSTSIFADDPDIGSYQARYTTITYPADLWVDINGVRYDPKTLPIHQYVSNWKDEWAELLLEFHPEYCLLQVCWSLDSSYMYDQMLMDVISYQQACDSGYFNPVGMMPDTLNCDSTHKDPFFLHSPGSTYLNDMKD